MNFSHFLDALYNRLAGLLAQGLIRRFETNQALDRANFDAELELRAKSLREAGAIATASRLESHIEQLADGHGKEGLAFINELLSDQYSSDAQTSEETSLLTSSSDEPALRVRGRGRRSKKVND